MVPGEAFLGIWPGMDFSKFWILGRISPEPANDWGTNPRGSESGDLRPSRAAPVGVHSECRAPARAWRVALIMFPVQPTGEAKFKDV